MSYLFYNALEDLIFDDLPEDLQYEIEELADRRAMNIDELWVEIQIGDFNLPRNLKKQLAQEIRSCSDYGNH